jgi:hypothetical protein
MESHEWFDSDSEGKTYYRANFVGGRWTIMTTKMKRNPEWEDLAQIPIDVWQRLRDILFNKYQRKRLPWERVAEIDRLIESEQSEP